MNYRHAFHAGNFADVFKHALLARLLLYLTKKDAPFRVIDTHAGEGAYDLASPEAERSPEWRGGIARLRALSDAGPAAELLRSYLEIVGPRDPEGRPNSYPGSPLIALALMRPQDRAVFCELRPDAYDALRARLSREHRAKAIPIDGYVGLGAFVPPKERRGLVLVDPPFERRDEDAALAQAFAQSWRKWPTGVYALWRPIKERSQTRAFYEALAASGARKMLALELDVGGAGAGLRRTGLVVVNPPYVFEAEARLLLAFLAERLAQGPGAGFWGEWIVGE